MDRLSINETTTFRWSFEQDVEAYAAAGISAMGVWRQKLSDCGVLRAAELLRAHGVRASHLFWAGGFTGSDGRTYRESIDDAREALHTAAAIEAKTLVVYSGPRAGHTHNHARRLIRDALKDLANDADRAGLTLALEPMHPGCAAHWTFLTCLDDALVLIEAVDSPAVQLVLDTYHLGQQPGLVDRIGSIASRIALVQLGDARAAPSGEQNRCRLGEGIVPLPQIVCALEQAGYRGFYDVELIGEAVEEFDYHALLAHAKQAFSQLLADKPC